jgi:predicted transcriptional regulator
MKHNIQIKITDYLLRSVKSTHLFDYFLKLIDNAQLEELIEKERDQFSKYLQLKSF